jgi:NAD(P)H-flavin reductase
MPIDVEAEVLWNRRLSPDYNVLALAAPAIATDVEPGQFVMVKAADGQDPLLRRPFSVFEILRGEHGQQATGFTILSKRVGAGTARSAARSRRSIRRTPRGSSPAASVSRPSRRWPNGSARTVVR